MAKKISQLTQATQVKSDDVTVIVQDGETKKLPLNTLVTKQDIENKKVAGLAKLDEIEATYENDTYTPTITVKNKSSVKVGEGDGVDYSANVMDGHAKSAILKGQTLVNVAYFKQGLYNYTDYNLLFIDKTKSYFIKFNTTFETTQIGFIVDDYAWNASKQFNATKNGYVIIKPDEAKDINALRVRFNGNTDKSFIPTLDLICIEYQEGMENWDIPYFEGMQSVKMPVLTTTGKNLFDGKLEMGSIDNATGLDVLHSFRMRSNYIKVKSGTTYTLSSNESTYHLYVCEYDANKSFIKFIFDKNNKTFTTSSTTNYIRFRTDNNETEFNIEIQLEESSIKTSYEPYKSNILTVNEDVTLRGIGDVQDELNLLTGELTERIGEVVLDGSEDENWHIDMSSNNVTRLNMTFKVGLDNIIDCDFATTGMLCDRFIQVTGSSLWANDVQGVGSSNGSGLKIGIPKSNLTTQDVNGFRYWLSQNPVTVQYQLATESIKTVDLTPSGTHPSTTPYCWKNGHIQLSSSGLLPSLEYSVVTSRAGQINQNATMIVKNDKRIFDLEILLAGGLVNTTYQALTLQNQVETGLSKVSLSSETEPDYLLYHMIMKLIEEKAYKLDDLTEKVSVFYLYEKLSDEQFETIYSALYPFVEDEVIM